MKRHGPGDLVTLEEVAQRLRITEDEAVKLAANDQIRIALDCELSRGCPVLIIGESLREYIERHLDERVRAALKQQELLWRIQVAQGEDEDVFELVTSEPLINEPLDEAIEKAKLIVIERIRASGEGATMKRRWDLAPRGELGERRRPVKLPPPQPSEVASRRRAKNRQAQTDEGGP